jgi:hypothetical protein
MGDKILLVEHDHLRKGWQRAHPRENREGVERYALCVSNIRVVVGLTGPTRTTTIDDYPISETWCHVNVK